MMAPSEVNDTSRQQMADAAYQWRDSEWFVFDNNTAVSKAGSATFKVTGDVTANYLVNRRVKIFSDATAYGTIISSSFSSPDTTVGLEIDDSGSLGASFTAAALGIIKPSNSSLPTGTNVGINLLTNGQFNIAQRGTSFTSATTPANSDDTYLLDRWILLSDGNDIVDVSQHTTTVPNGSDHVIQLDVETANAKFGILQVLEHTESEKIIGKVCSLSFKARANGSNATLDTLRAAVISWSSTADSVTSDVVSAWNVEGTDPTLVANWTYENTPSNLTLSTSEYTTFKIENISIDTASTNNVAVFIWCDNGDATVGDIAYITDVKLEEGYNATAYPFEPIADMMNRCQRYYQVFGKGVNGGMNGTSGVIYGVNAKVPMRASPTASLLKTEILIESTGVAVNTASGCVIASSTLDPRGARVNISGNGIAGTTNAEAAIGQTEAFLSFESEL